MIKYIKLGLYYNIKKKLKVNKIKAIRDFLTVIRNNDLYFSIIYNVKFNKNEFIDIFKLIKLFK